MLLMHWRYQHQQSKGVTALHRAHIRKSDTNTTSSGKQDTIIDVRLFVSSKAWQVVHAQVPARELPAIHERANAAKAQVQKSGIDMMPELQAESCVRLRRERGQKAMVMEWGLRRYG